MTTESEKLTIAPDVAAQAADAANPANVPDPATNGPKLTKAGKPRKPRGPRPDKLVILKAANSTGGLWSIVEIVPLGLKKATPAKLKKALQDKKIPGEFKIMTQKGLGFVVSVANVELAVCKDVE